MYSRLKNIPRIDGTLVATPTNALFISLLIFTVCYGVYGHSLALSEQLNLPQGPPVGGDFVAFWGAAKALFNGTPAEIYQPEVYEAWLMHNTIVRERFGLTWQYPPTYYLVIWPLAFMPFVAGYALWTGGTFALFIGTLRKTLCLPWLALAIVIALPVCFNTVITGQNGFLTAALLAGAALLPDKRPVIAGLCAGLLTIKPQLGLLLPVAYIAAGCWRAFATAAVTALLMAGVSLVLIGLAPWLAFFEAVIGVGDGVGQAAYPLRKMPTVFAALQTLGLPSAIAMAVQGIIALGAIGLTFFAWRRLQDTELRAALLCSLVFLCTPYAYYYEMTILVLPAIILVRQACMSGYLKLEEAGLIALWGAPIFLPGMAEHIGAVGWFSMVVILIALVLRRALPAMGLKFASEASQAPAY